ncbi:MAG TPA: alanine racemase [Longimicrobiales bacterium]
MSIAPDARAWVEVDLGALRANFETIRRRVGPAVKMIAMVKADGYGLGAERVVRALDPLEPWAYGVATVDEGGALRRLGVERPVLVFSPLPPDAFGAAAELRLTPAISDLGALERWAHATANVPGGGDFHVEIDTGMGRCGFDWRDTSRWAEAVRARVSPQLRWTGVFTHFHGADSPEAASTTTQWERFRDALEQLPVSREDLIVHAANSAGAVRFPEFAADAVRPGIFLYGGHPAPAVPGVPAPRPVAAVRARIVLVRDVAPGTTVGYGATHVARKWERWGTLGIGYGDGLRRALGNRADAIVRGRRVRTVGRISMDLTVVDLTGVPEARVGDVATLIGRDGDEEITLEEVAAHADTIAYEILTGLTPRLPRVEREHGIDG